MPSIAGQSILIIGGSSGIGSAVAKLAIEQGARIAIASSNPDCIANAVQRLEQSFPDSQIAGHECDLSNDDIESRLEKLFTDVTTGNGLLNHLVYTAGIINVRPILEVDVDYLCKAGHLAFVAPLLIAKFAPRFLKSSYTSSLVFTSGRVAERPIANYSVASSYAAGLFGMIRNLALDLAPVRMNLVSPGSTETELWGPNRAQMREAVAKNALLGKAGTAEEVAEAYIYLMKDTNTTGSCVSTNGGALLK